MLLASSLELAVFFKVLVVNVLNKFDSFSTEIMTFIIKIELVILLFGMIITSFTEIRIDFTSIINIHHTFIR